MKKHEIEPPLTHALNERGELKYVRDVPIGDACGCICPKCKEPLIAKHCYNEGKSPHFAHVSGKVCIGAQMSALHLRAQQIIVEKLAVMAPAYKKYNRTVKSKKLEFINAFPEECGEWEGIRPDVVCEDVSGNKWSIEIFYTNAIDDNRRRIIIDQGIPCLEIDVNKVKYEDLEEFLINSAKHRYWINNPIYDKILYKKEWECVSKITYILLNKPAIKIPDHSQNKYIQSNEIQYVTKDELNTIIKLQTTDGCVYSVFVGTYESVNKLYGFLQKYYKSYTGVLAVYTDETLAYDIELKKDYDYKWLKREILNLDNYIKSNQFQQTPQIFVNESPEEKRYNEYLKQSSKYLILPYTGIAYSCELQKDCKQCEYCKDIVSHNGEIFAVCDSLKLKNCRTNQIIEPLENQTQSNSFKNKRNYPKPLFYDSLEDFYFYIEEKRIINWNGNDNHVEYFILSVDKKELYVLHFNTRDLCYLSKFTWQKFNYLVETKSGTYEEMYNDYMIIKESMNVRLQDSTVSE